MAFDGPMPALAPRPHKSAPTLTKRRRRALEALSKASGHSIYELAPALSAYSGGMARQGLAPRGAGLEHALDRIATCLEMGRGDVMAVK